jgi:predicted PurR-regulated permease PerM
MERVYVSAKRDMAYRNSQSTLSTLLIVVCFIVFALISFFMMSAHGQLREELIEMLRREREVTDMNNKLKTELAGIMQARMLELKAKERLGLKKPKDEEVLVLR